MENQQKKSYAGKLDLFFAFFWGFILILSFSYLIIIEKEGDAHIAVVVPLSGKHADQGEKILEGVRLCVDTINSKGGIRNRHIILDVYDDQNDVNEAVKIARKIVSNGQTLAVIGHYSGECSVAAGKIYKAHRIPAINPASKLSAITKDNEWYFSVMNSSVNEARFAANYIRKIIGFDTVSLIYEDIPERNDFAGVFQQECEKIGISISYGVSLPAEGEMQDMIIDEIGNEISQKKNLGMIFLATTAETGMKLVKIIRDKGIRNVVGGLDDFAARKFSDGFNSEPIENIYPGYYTNEIFVLSSLLFDSGSEKTQQFKEMFFKKYQKDPSILSAYGFDAVLLVSLALKKPGEHPKPCIESSRECIRQYLSGLNTMALGIEGVTGNNHFNAEGTAEKEIYAGVYKSRLLISTFNQIRPIRFLNEIMDIEKAILEGNVIVIGDNYFYKTNIVKTGIRVNKIDEINTTDSTCSLDFNLWFRYQGNLHADDIDFENSVEPVDMGKPIKEESDDLYTYRLYHVRGLFRIDYLSVHLLPGEHLINISFHHKSLTRNNLIYLMDSVGMGLHAGDLARQSLEKAQFLGKAQNWSILSVRFFENSARGLTQGDPDYLNLYKGVLEYSKFNMAVKMKQKTLHLRGLPPVPVAQKICIIAFALILFNFFILRNRDRSIPSLWVFQILSVLVFLLSFEVAIYDALSRWMNLLYLNHTIIRMFDILWWIIPAFLIHRTIERFFWRPLERKTDRRVPNLVRHFAAFIIYLLAAFGVIGFVFDQKLTSLLATSGVVAMIIGLAIQMNISNIFSGIAINLEHPFRIGDWVKIGDHGQGRVIDITWRSTRVRTLGASVISIPNTLASETKVVNYDYPDSYFWDAFTLHVDPSYPPERVKKIVNDAVLITKGIEDAWIAFLGFSDWAADYQVGFRAKNYEFRRGYVDKILEQILVHFESTGIKLAFKKQDIFMHRVERKGIKEPESILKTEHILGNIDLLQPIAENLGKGFFEDIDFVSFKKGSIIVRQGESGDCMYVITEGIVSVQVVVDRQDPIEVARLSVGDFFGEMSLFTGESRTATVIAITDMHALKISKSDIEPFLKNHPDLMSALVDVVNQRQIYLKQQKECPAEETVQEESLKSKVFDKMKRFFFSDNQCRGLETDDSGGDE